MIFVLEGHPWNVLIFPNPMQHNRRTVHEPVQSLKKQHNIIIDMYINMFTNKYNNNFRPFLGVQKPHQQIMVSYLSPDLNLIYFGFKSHNSINVIKLKYVQVCIYVYVCRLYIFSSLVTFNDHNRVNSKNLVVYYCISPL